MRTFNLFINNDFVKSADDSTFQSIDPAKNEPIAELSKATIQDVNKAVRAARNGFDSGIWKGIDGDQRADLMLKAAYIMKKRLKENRISA